MLGKGRPLLGQVVHLVRSDPSKSANISPGAKGPDLSLPGPPLLDICILHKWVSLRLSVVMLWVRMPGVLTRTLLPALQGVGGKRKKRRQALPVLGPRMICLGIGPPLFTGEFIIILL